VEGATVTLAAYQPGTVTIRLRDGRTFVYASDTPPADVVADLRAQGIRDGDIGSTLHVVRTGSSASARILGARERES
jgi:hypothetical protein